MYDDTDQLQPPFHELREDLPDKAEMEGVEQAEPMEVVCDDLVSEDASLNVHTSVDYKSPPEQLVVEPRDSGACEEEKILSQELNQELPSPEFQESWSRGSQASRSEREEQNSVSVMDSGEAPVLQKEQQISKLEAELAKMRQYVDCIQSERADAAKAHERSNERVADIQADLDAAVAAVKEMKAECQAKNEAQEKQQVLLNEALGKLEMQSRFLESGSSEANAVRECIDLQQSCLEMKQKLAEKDGILRNLRECQEQLRNSHKVKEEKFREEKEEVINALEASELKSEEQRMKLRELESELTRYRMQASHLEKRCATAEGKASESSSLMEELQSKLDSTIMELFELRSSNSQVESMRVRLNECEKALSQATSQKALVECSLRELKQREEHLLEVEQGHKDVQERLKWRNEQFQSLEEAHSKLRAQFKENKSDWDAERGGLLTEMESLQGTLDSKERLLQDVQRQLQMVHQALAHEESRRKVLELQASEARQGLEHATAEFEAAQSAIEVLREQTSSEIGSLRNNIGEKDRQLKDLQVKHLHMEQDYDELKSLEKEYRAWMSTHGDQQKQMESMKEKMARLIEAHDSLRLRLKDQEKGFEQEKRDMVMALDLAADNLTARDQSLKQLEDELEKVKGALAHVKVHRSDLDSQLKECKESLERACEEATKSRQDLFSLEKISGSDKALLLESLHGKDKIIQELKAQIVILNQTINELNKHEEKWQAMKNECEGLQQLLIQRDTERKEMERIHNSLLMRQSEEEKAWLIEKEKLVSELQLSVQAVTEKAQEAVDLHYKIDRHQDVISKLEAKCAAHVEEIAKYCMEAEKAKQMLSMEILEMEKITKEVRIQNESLFAALSHKDLAEQKLKDQIRNLESEIQEKDAQIGGQMERVSLMEKRVKETYELQCNMEQHIAAMKAQACEDVEELKRLEEARLLLEEELRKSQEQHLSMKTDMERKLESVQRDLSSSSMRLKGVTKQLDEEISQKDLLLKDLDSKECCLTGLQEEKKTLLVEKTALQQVVQVLETKKLSLLLEVENSKSSIDQLCNKLETAEASLASRCVEVKDLQAKIQNAHKVGAQLLHAEGQIKELEGYLKAAKAIAQDKEEKLAASEWAVQQLALDVSKAKNAFQVKEREEALLREDMADLERQLRGKEGELIEMECYLEDAVLARKSMQEEVDNLHQRMDDLDRGASEWKKQELDMTAQLEALGAALEEKRVALVTSELEVKRGRDLCQVMEGAIDSLKLQLADEQKALCARQTDMNRLCEDLELTRDAANSSAELVKELQGRLQQLEQSSEDRLKKFQSTVCELQQELSVAHSQLENFEVQMQALSEDSSRYKEKCEALLDLNGRKDCALKDLEGQLQGVQTGLLEQSSVVEQREQELRLVKEQLQYQDERRINLEESFSRIQAQTAELQVCNEQLASEVRKLTSQLNSSSLTNALRSEEIESLKAYVEQLKAIAAKEGETQSLATKLSEELQASSKTVQDREARIRLLDISLNEAQEQLQVIEGVLAKKDLDAELSQEKLFTAERTIQESQMEITKMQEALRLAQCDLTEKSQMISSYVSMMNVMEVEVAEWKERAKSATLEGGSLKEELQATSNRALEGQRKAKQLQESLEDARLELKEKTAMALQHLASVGDLQVQLNDWKEKSAAAIEEKLVFQTALEEAERKHIEKDHLVESLQESLGKAEVEISQCLSSVATLQTELADLRVHEAAVSKEGNTLKKQLEIVQMKSEANQEELLELNEILESSRKDAKEKAEQLSQFAALSTNMEVELSEWKGKAAAAEVEVRSLRAQLEGVKVTGEEHHQEVIQMNEAMTKMEQALLEERKRVQVLIRVEEELINERGKVAESRSLIADLGAVVEEWKSKAAAAADEGAGVKLQLSHATKKLSSLMLQVEEHKVKEQSLENLNHRLQCDLTMAEQEVLARKEKMHSFLLQLEQSQKSERDVLEKLRKEHKKLSDDVEGEEVGFRCPSEEEADHDVQLQGSGKVLTGRSKGLALVGELRENDDVFPESQNSAEDCALAMTNESLEKELVVLKLQAEESQQEAHKLAGKLDAALSNLATKNLIIKQVHDEITGLRAVVKRLEQEKLLQADSKQIVTERIPSGNECDFQDVTCTLNLKPANQEELNHYLELCDSLVRKNVRLEKQLDGLQRKNRGLQKQVEGLQMFEKTSGDKLRKSLERLDVSPDQDLRGFSRKMNSKSVLQDRRLSPLQDLCKGKVLGEIDENVFQGSLLPSQISRRPPVSPAAIPLKKARRVLQEES